ncbi:MAG TPA: adenylate/guanylate cyclase domain-containing protein [Acidimicrobiales bacterium]|nr:adenylate/guanylate cyclase domain-containing protein [Acidimicrobiales bacterium]
MIDVPEIQYAVNGDVHLAYQVVGEGPPDIVFIWGPFSNIEVVWEHPPARRNLERFSSFGRLIQFDRRGTGLSDRAVALPTLEEQMDDVVAVLDAVGSDRAALIGGGDGAFMTLLFAATHPDRTSALVLSDARVRIVASEDFPWAFTAEQWADLRAMLRDNWGSGISQYAAAPSTLGDETARQWWARLERQSLGPGDVTRMFDLVVQTDVRPVLPTIQVPTLVLHRTGDQFCPIAQGRYYAEHIPGARFVELPGEDHAGWEGDADPGNDEIEEFITGHRPMYEPDRVLATVLFTDIVGSTEKARELGDRRWRELLDHHDELARAQLDRHQGRLVKTTGDGLLATFDGPARAIRCASTLRQILPVPIRAGLHTGEVELRGDDVGGIAVHIGARVAAIAGAGEVLVSRTVKDLVAGSGITFTDRGSHTLKGVPDEWQLYAVAN